MSDISNDPFEELVRAQLEALGEDPGREGLRETPERVARSFSFLTHFDSVAKGVIDLRDLVFFFSLIAFWLFANAIVIDLRKAE